MSWLHGDSRGPQYWKQGWKAHAFSSCSLPPARLLAFFAIVIFFLSVSSYVDYKRMEQRAEVGIRVFAVPLTIMLVFVLCSLLWDRRWTSRVPAVHDQRSIHQAGSSPWGVAMLVVLLLMMVSFQPSVHSMWFRPLWFST